MYSNKINIICTSIVESELCACHGNLWNHKEESLSPYRGL